MAITVSYPANVWTPYTVSVCADTTLWLPSVNTATTDHQGLHKYRGDDKQSYAKVCLHG